VNSTLDRFHAEQDGPLALLNGIISLHLFTGNEARRSERILSTIDASLKTFTDGLKVRF